MIETFMHSMGTIVSRNEDHIIWNERFLQFSSVLLCTMWMRRSYNCSFYGTPNSIYRRKTTFKYTQIELCRYKPWIHSKYI